MAKRVPEYIKEEARRLNNALAAVSKHASTIEEWVDKNTDVDSFDFFCDNKLDNPYEFNLADVLAALEAAVE